MPIEFRDKPHANAAEQPLDSRLHALTPAAKPAYWQTPEFQKNWLSRPPIFDHLIRYTAGSLAIDMRNVEITFLGEEKNAGENWKQHVSLEVAAEIERTLRHIAERWGDLGVLEEVSVCLRQPMNPENREPANGYSPTAFIVDQKTQQVSEVPSGTIIVFPHALKPEVALKPYRGKIKDLPHIAGVVAHEWAHQFMSSENTDLFQTWVESVPGWRKNGDSWVIDDEMPLPTPYSYKNPTDDFVESLALYLLRPELLQQEHPERFAFCEEFSQMMHE